jgi:hypothetical protein
MGLQLKQHSLDLDVEVKQEPPINAEIKNKYDYNAYLATRRAKFSAHIHDAMQYLHSDKRHEALEAIDIALSAARDIYNLKKALSKDTDNGGL